ncbi:DNA gyrase inhibitor YacG [Sphingomonas sp. Leaf412]|uniref:DNA gyrase inhibitor YacG n=1 Tax=Sphingomonas sp. Leaf412 TaxID=1736370 RepID=UPI0009E8E19A|nr:DNA gyrase inhibitor YacG [Sphingomonas sp. Leaf412]
MTASCPICDGPVAAPHAPFCSPRCRDRDLLAWLGEGYRLPGPSIDTEALDRPENAD